MYIIYIYIICKTHDILWIWDWSKSNYMHIHTSIHPCIHASMHPCIHACTHTNILYIHPSICHAFLVVACCFCWSSLFFSRSVPLDRLQFSATWICWCVPRMTWMGASSGVSSSPCYGNPLVNIQKTVENGPVEIVDLPIENEMVDFSSSLCKRLPEGKLWKMDFHMDHGWTVHGLFGPMVGSMIYLYGDFPFPIAVFGITRG